MPRQSGDLPPSGPLGPPGRNVSPSGIRTEVFGPPDNPVAAAPPWEDRPRPVLTPQPVLRRMLAAARAAKAQGMAPAASRALARDPIPRPGEHPIERDLRQRSNARLRWPPARP